MNQRGDDGARGTVAAIALVAFGLVVYAPTLSAESSSGSPATWKQALPLLERYCFDCHDSDVAKGDVDLAVFRDEAEAMESHELWEVAGRLVHDYEMPPSDKKKQPTEAERATIQSWIHGALDRVALANAGDPGRVTIRRLNNAEFDNTIRELTGLSLNLSRHFPKDGGGGEGFANTGDILFTSPDQLEKYITAARQVAERAEILPGTGLTFQSDPVGIRGAQVAKSELLLRSNHWYRERAAELLPKTDADLRIADYSIAIWKYAHRDVTGVGEDLANHAKKEGLDPDFLANWWTFFNLEKPTSRFTGATWTMLRDMPAPDPKRPKEVPESVREIAANIAHWRHAWLVEVSPGYSVQRLQQDMDSLKQVKAGVTIDEGEGRVVSIVVTPAGDGAAGDLVRWDELKLQMRSGGEQNLFDYLRSHRDWHQKELSALPDGQNQDQRAQHIATLENLSKILALPGTHPQEGKNVPAPSFVVQAPFRIDFWVNDDVGRVIGFPNLIQDHPERDKATVQAYLALDLPSRPLPALVAGQNIIWHRSTSGHWQTSKEFVEMKNLFPDSRDRRIDKVELNITRPADRFFGIYHLNDDQLSRRLPVQEQGIPQALKTDLFFTERGDSLSKENAKMWDKKLLGHLHQFAKRAWRRPISKSEIAGLSEVYQAALRETENREEAAREVVVRLLVSPHFLFKTEPPRGNDAETKLNAWQLASRLSYFLWASMPDERRFSMAADGSILDPKNLDDQVKPMLADWRGRALAREFAGQWFGFSEFLKHSTVDSVKFKIVWGDGVRWSMYREVIVFFEELVKHDRPVTDILHANYSYIDARLAKHYGVNDFEGGDGQFKKWPVSAQGRGGILGMGAILVKTSYPSRTSPVLRGDWVLRTVLGKETPPPPADVPELDGEQDANLGLRARLEKHREAKACAGCHARIDPPGFALENFDAIGRWRDKDGQGRPIDARAELRDGTKFEGPAGLRSHLLAEQDAFLRQFCTKLLGYALGREVGIGDRPLLEEMEAALERDGYRFSAAVRTIVNSRQFRNRKN